MKLQEASQTVKPLGSPESVPDKPAPTPERFLALAFALLGAGKFEQAQAAVWKALQLNPRYVAAYVCLAEILSARGDFEAAVSAYKGVLALQPGHALACNNLGGMYFAANRHSEALDCFLAGVLSNPTVPELYNNLGLAMRKLKPDSASALKSFEKALELKPDYADALNNLGSAWRELGDQAQAKAYLQRSLELYPERPQAWNDFGLLELDAGRLHKACEHFEKALALQPDYEVALNNLGVAQRYLGQHSQSLASFSQAVRLKPDYPSALNNLGNALKDEGLFAQSIAAYRKCLEYRPEDPETHNNLAMALLASGDYEQGFKEYRWRWQTRQLCQARREFVQPLWDGSGAPGKTLLIYSEQGFGDTLQFCRYACLAKERGLNVLLEVQPPLARLCRSLKDVDLVLSGGGELPGFDYQLPMLDLPLLFASRPEDVLSAPSYLAPQAEDVAAWAEKLGQAGLRGLRVGLVWAGKSRHNCQDLMSADKRRSLNSQLLKPLFELPGISFVSLQKDGPAGPKDCELCTLIDNSRDFADTAALIQNLDLVISVDTAVAHLASAIGKPVWMLNRFDSCWRWKRGAASTPWYPRMRIFNQKAMGDWQGVIEELRLELSKLLSDAH